MQTVPLSEQLCCNVVAILENLERPRPCQLEMEQVRMMTTGCKSTLSRKARKRAKANTNTRKKRVFVVRFCNGLKMVLIRVVRYRRGRCLFRHRGVDAVVNPPVTRTEEEDGVELAALWKAVSKLASSLMWRAGQHVDVSVPQVMEESTVERTDSLPVCGDGAEGSDVGVHGEQVKEAVASRKACC